ncbi:MAG: hydrogenase iron-sulfur subunit [Desulfomonilaceae bacterium]
MFNLHKNHSLSCTVPNQSALVVGNGLTASMVVAAINSVGLDVTHARFGSNSSTLFHSCDNESFITFLDQLIEQLPTVEGPQREPTEIVPCENGFLVTFDSGESHEFGSVFLAIEGTLKPASKDLPAEVTTITPDRPTASVVSSVCFLLDYKEITNPSIGAHSIRVALENQVAGGHSFVLLRQTPVKGLLGETLYEAARLAGVRFLRYGTKLPKIERLSTPIESSDRFKVSVADIIESGEEISFDCDCVFVGANPIIERLPDGFRNLLSEETDQQGFLIQDSVHCLTGKSFHKGVYCVGPSSGCVDLFETMMTAACTAVDAAAWLNLANTPQSEEKMSVTEQCIRCLTCIRLCPHSAITLNAEASRSNVKVSTVRCVECGICVAECPRTALDLNSFLEDSFSSLIDRLKTETSEDAIVVFGCYRSAGRAISEINLPGNVIFFPVSCAGRLSESILSATLATRVKGILILGCHHGNCRSNNGTDWARVRLANMSKKLGSLFGKVGVISYKTLAPNESARMLRLINNFSSSVFGISD